MKFERQTPFERSPLADRKRDSRTLVTLLEAMLRVRQAHFLLQSGLVAPDGTGTALLQQRESEGRSGASLKMPHTQRPIPERMEHRLFSLFAD